MKTCLPILLAVAVLPVGRSFAQKAAGPTGVLVSGVPFVGWGEAARVRYEHYDVRNPSHEAAIRMIVGYWIDGSQTTERYQAAWKSLERRAEWHEQGGSVQELKRHIARGAPVLVIAALTPTAHPLYSAFSSMIEMGMVKKPREGPRSGALGAMLPLDAVQSFTKKVHTNPVQESVVSAFRVIVGYDDNRQVFVVHDPSFGPAWEVPYADFERMWKAADGAWMVVYPENSAAVVSMRATSPPYRPRTADEQAATRFVYGYALSGTGQVKEGEQAFRQGLALPGVSVGYQHLLQFELALTLGELNRVEDAIAAADSATVLIPENPGPWSFLVDLYRLSSRSDHEQRAADARHRAAGLEGDAAAKERLAKALPSDFFIDYMAPIRGWASGAPAQTP